MNVFSLLYASRSVIPLDRANSEVVKLVDVSRTRNRELDVTGCLIFARHRFAQVLEGDEAAVESIMASISRDRRHTDITFLQRGETAARQFSGWALGYVGASFFVQRTIARPAAQALRGSSRGTPELLAIMMAFGSEQPLVSQ